MSDEEPAKHATDVFCNRDLLVKWFDTDQKLEIEGYLPDDDVHPVFVLWVDGTVRDGRRLTTSKFLTEANQLYHKYVWQFCVLFVAVRYYCCYYVTCCTFSLNGRIIFRFLTPSRSPCQSKIPRSFSCTW